MLQYDRVVCQKFKDLNQNLKVKLAGECSSYNNCDDVWKFILKSCEIKCDAFSTSSGYCKVVAMDA